MAALLAGLFLFLFPFLHFSHHRPKKKYRICSEHMSNDVGGPSDVNEMGLGLKCSVRDETKTLNL